MDSAPVTVVETPEFLTAVRKLMDEDERMSLVDHLARNPRSGDIIPGTGGVRKLRWALEGRGKRGGTRVIYFYHNEALPLFVFTAYAKSAQGDLSKEAQNRLRQAAKLMVERYGKE